jgi:hypothetical protein
MSKIIFKNRFFLDPAMAPPGTTGLNRHYALPSNHPLGPFNRPNEQINLDLTSLRNTPFKLYINLKTYIDRQLSNISN